MELGNGLLLLSSLKAHSVLPLSGKSYYYCKKNSAEKADQQKTDRYVSERIIMGREGNAQSSPMGIVNFTKVIIGIPGQTHTTSVNLLPW